MHERGKYLLEIHKAGTILLSPFVFPELQFSNEHLLQDVRRRREDEEELSAVASHAPISPWGS